jgi:hypothetical protein
MYSHFKKERYLAICSNINETRGHYIKLNKPEKERKILRDLTYIWNLQQKVKLDAQKQNMERSSG